MFDPVQPFHDIDHPRQSAHPIDVSHPEGRANARLPTEGRRPRSFPRSYKTFATRSSRASPDERYDSNLENAARLVGPRGLFLPLLAGAALLLNGCSSIDRLLNIGEQPKLSSIEKLRYSARLAKQAMFTGVKRTHDPTRAESHSKIATQLLPSL